MDLKQTRTRSRPPSNPARGRGMDTGGEPDVRRPAGPGKMDGWMDGS
ncbi:unnamed protein product [Staurois parvus]|uniref:Uncharacterized protein n=1 Tax=Staurois parvus TaxID=386267 RepID=A0ABN9CJZ0_9NEOB|nr:unnamed protein product [Staurois parvus]